MGIVLKGGHVVELEPAAVERVDLRIEDARIVARGPELQPLPDDEVVAPVSYTHLTLPTKA